MILRKESRNTMPENAMVLAGMTLMLHALDFVNRTGMLKIGAPELDQATHIFADRLLQLWHIGPQQLQQMAAQTHKVMQDPAQMELLARHAGVVKDPRANEPRRTSSHF